MAIPVRSDHVYEGGSRITGLPPAIAAGQPRTFEQDDTSVVIDIIGNCISGALPPYLVAGISSGTVAVANSAAVDANRPFAIKLRLGATTNGGGRIVTDSSMRLLRPTFQYVWVNFNTLTNSTFRIGIHNTTTFADAADGCYWEIINGTVTAKIANNSVRSQLTGTPPTPTLGAQDWYRFEVLVTPDPVTPANSTALFTMRDKNLNSLFSETLTGANIPTTRLVGNGIVATNTGTSATDLCHVHQLRIRITGVSR